MGVSGCGKTTVGNTLAHRLGLPFADADDFHPEANVAKMAGGQPLTDEDRWPWLDAVGTWLAGRPEGGVVACSALRVAYRDAIRRRWPEAYFLHLDGAMEVAIRRVAARIGHFLPAGLVQSQYDLLEPLEDREAGAAISFDAPVTQIIAQALRVLGAADGASV
ncbi:MAG: gluconokinase [Gordonia sp. (in: high G+C Gram-positive bacteria)]